jgi:hypothetical protein
MQCNLSSLRQNIAALCYERTRVQGQQNLFRHCPRDERHDEWEKELQGIEMRRMDLVQQQQSILKRSRECGIVCGTCI